MTESASLGATVAFVAGLLSFLSPCVLPLVPSYLGFITGFTLEEMTGRRRLAMVHSLLFVIGLMTLYPILWLNMILGLPALAYSIYLLYTGLPVVMEVNKDQGFLFASAVLAVGLVVLVAVMAATVILWGYGIAPVYTSSFGVLPPSSLT